jgi:hypothetical protein
MVLEGHAPRGHRKQRIVLPEADIDSGAEAAATLANEDGPALYDVAVKAFDAETLRLAVSTVSGTALSLFMRHLYSCLRGFDAGDPHAGPLRPMPKGSAHSASPLLREDPHFLVLDHAVDDTRPGSTRS